MKSQPLFRPVAILAAVVVLLTLPALAQIPGAGDEGKRPPVRVYIDSPFIPASAIEKGLSFLAHVRSPGEAEVIVEILPPRPEGAPAASIKIRGSGEFAAISDDLQVPAPPGKPREELEAEVIRVLRLALLRFATKTSAAARLSVAFEDAVKPTAVTDPWHFWVFNLGVDGFFNGEEVYRMTMLSGNFSAQKVTPDWKIRFGGSLNSSKNVYDVEDYHYESTSKSRSATALVVRSLDEHWSAGASLQLSYSTYNNTAFRLAPQAAVEYDLFKYSESTRRQLRFLYAIGPAWARYLEETIYDKTKETLWSHSLSTTLELKQPWGTISSTLAGSQYFHDLSRYKLSLEANVSLRIFEGFNFNVNGGGSRIHDQLFLPKAGATFEEVLLQRRQLETGYDYFFSVGLSFTFGSTRSNVVNPRFE